jgi:hypothetical protein
MISETTIFISAVFELVGLNKGGNDIGLPMISMCLLWLSWPLVRLGQVLRALYRHTGLGTSFRPSQERSTSLTAEMSAAAGWQDFSAAPVTLDTEGAGTSTMTR